MGWVKWPNFLKTIAMDLKPIAMVKQVERQCPRRDLTHRPPLLRKEVEKLRLFIFFLTLFFAEREGRQAIAMSG